MNRKHNHQTKNIRDFTSEDTLYIQKTAGDNTFTYLVKFIKFERGIVHGEIIGTQYDHIPIPHDRLITARLKKCFLWNENLIVSKCRWFNKEGFAK